MRLPGAQWRCKLEEFASYKAAIWVLAASAIPFTNAHNSGAQQKAFLPDAEDGLTEIFQLYTPPWLPIVDTNRPHDDFSGEVCSTIIFQHDFVNSYGHPAVANYTAPPASCQWNSVSFHLHTTSKGRQYDRLAFIFLNDTELWRTSTAEPTPNGIFFTYTKDLTHFKSILGENGTIIMEMGNMVTDVLTGSFAVTLSAHYFNLDIPSEQKPADVILPISSGHGSQGQPSHFTLPNDVAKKTISVPKNVTKAVLSIIASGNAEEEFWYTNVPDNLKESFAGNPLLGHSSYREVQVFVDGVMVDVVMPVPTIYTGGINPGLWKPVVHPLAYDLWEFEVDITLWVAGKPDAVVEIKVEGLTVIDSGPNPRMEVGGGIGQNWYVSGRLFLWIDPTATPINPSLYGIFIYPPEVEYSYDISNYTKFEDQENKKVEKIISFTTMVSRKIKVVKKFTGDSRKILAWETTQRYFMNSRLHQWGRAQDLTVKVVSFEEITETTSDGEFGLLIENSELVLSVDSAFTPYADGSFKLYGKVWNSLYNPRTEGRLLTGKSPLILDYQWDERFGLAKSTRHWSIHDESTYFAASRASHNTSWINGYDQQSISYDLNEELPVRERMVVSYWRSVQSNFTHVVYNNEVLNGLPVNRIFKPLAKESARTPADTFAEDICTNGSVGRFHRRRLCRDQHP